MNKHLYASHLAAFCLCLVVAAVGCESEDGNTPADTTPTTIEIAGEWNDNFGTLETITADAWTAKGTGFESKTTIVEHDNAANWAITKSSADDAYSANKFAKRIWIEPKDGVFHYCSVVIKQDTAELAKATTLTANDSDLDGKGCGGFPWSKLTEKK